MIRALAEPLLFFTIPFALYILLLLLRLIDPFTFDRWTRRVVIPLILAGLVLALGSLVLVGLMAPRQQGSYVPAHEENGRIVPGRLR